MVATRYVSHDSESPASLYYAEGSAFQREPHETGARPESATPGAASNAASARNTAVTGMLNRHTTDYMHSHDMGGRNMLATTVIRHFIIFVIPFGVSQL